jgi:hypothetical protein
MMGTINLDGYQKRAKALYDTYQNAVAAAQNDTGWSAQGKQDVIAKAKAAYRVGMDALTAEANTAIERARESNAAARNVALAKEVGRRRGVLGDAVYADIVRRRVEGMRSDEIVKALEASPSEFERELLRAYGELEIAKRVGSAERTVYDEHAQKALQEQAAAVTAEIDAEAEPLAWELPVAVKKLDQLADEEARARFGEELRRSF